MPSGDSSSELALLSFAARLLLSQLDRRLLVERGLESFLDFARARAGAVFLLDATGERLERVSAQGAEDGAEAGGETPGVAVGEPPWPDALAGRRPRSFPLGVAAGAPAPAASAGVAGRECLCVPLVGGSNRILGAVTLDRAAADPLPEDRLQSLIVLQSILALGLEQAALRERLLEAHQELEGLYAAKSKMIDHLSHELKTPLAVLQASTALLRRDAVRADGDRAIGVLERMDRGLGRLLELQEEAQDIASAGADAVAAGAVAAHEIPLDRLVPEVLTAIAPLHRHRAVRVETDLQAAPLVMAPEPLLRKAVIGLVRNAIEATADGGWVRVEVGGRADGSVVLEVADSGVGFDEATRRQLFHGFVHAGSTADYASRRPYDFGAGGRGLDLLRTRLLADRHGFAIEVASEPGKGSRFRLVFPPRKVAPVAGPALAGAAAAPAPAAQTPGGPR